MRQASPELYKCEQFKVDNLRLFKVDNLLKVVNLVYEQFYKSKHPIH